ncbi:MAG: hypothetical protein E7580_07070 [Ruminococcaceae bacterium]|nr:hypothetical protein [Oscillospiraceae bacterium]
MKKLLALFLALMMVFSMVACSDSKGSDTDEDEVGYSSAEKVTKAFATAILEGDLETLIDCLPVFFVEALIDGEYDRDEAIEKAKEIFGHQDQYKLKILNTKESSLYDKDEVYEILADYFEYHGIEDHLDEIEDAKIISLEGTFKYGDEEKIFEYNEADESEPDISVKIDGRWFIIYEK